MHTDPHPQSCKTAIAEMKSCWGSYDSFETMLPTPFSYNKTTKR